MLMSLGKWLLAFLFFNVLGYAIWFSQGHFHPREIMEVFGAGMLFILSIFYKPTTLLRPLDENKWLAILIALTLCFFSYLIIKNPCVIYADHTLKAYKVFKFANKLNLYLSFCILALILSSANRLYFLNTLRWLCGSMMFLFFLNRILVLFISPHPHIDVFTALNRASEALFSGLNPYSIQYEDLYNGANGQPHLGYQPGIIVSLAPFWALFHDIRAAYIVSDLVTVTLLYKMSKHFKIQGALVYLLPILWLSFPVSYFILEQAWTDTFLVALTCGIMYTLLVKRWWLGAILGGFLSASKYYPALVPMMCTFYIYREAGFKSALGFALIVCGVTALLFAPFIYADLAQLIHHTFSMFVNFAPRPDSFSITSLSVNKIIFPLPSWFNGLATLAILAPTLLVMLRTKSNKFLWLANATGAIYFIFFMFAKQAFCNYYYFLSFFIFIAVLIQSKSSVHSDPASS